MHKALGLEIVSLPPRERGLKYLVLSIFKCMGILSLPPRERGLKFFNFLEECLSLPSLPPRERGLKYTLFCHSAKPRFVAPSAGAWIEITDEKSVSSVLYCLNVKLQVP